MKKYISTLLAISLALLGIYFLWHVVRQPVCHGDDASDTQTTKSALAKLGDTIVIGTNAEYPPFSFLRDGTIVGFDIDVAQEVAKRLGKQVKLLDMPFDMLLPYLQLGNVQIIAAGISPKPSRAKHVLFTKPYLENDPLLVITPANASKINSLDDLAGKTVVVNDGYTADTYMSSRPDVKVQRLATPAEALLALGSGRAYAYIAAKSSVQRFLSTHATAYNSFSIADTADAYALVISPLYPELLPIVQEALDAMTSDGTLDALKKTWGLV